MGNEKPDLNRAIRQLDWKLVIELVNDGADVNVNDAPGMTPLHLAAREIKADVIELLLEKRANANALTSRARKPGGYCALASLADIGTQGSRWDEIVDIAKLFFHQMEMEKVAVLPVPDWA